MGDLTGRRAIVLAASRGIGRAIVERFAAEGAAVALCSRDETAAETVARKLSNTHGVEAWGQGVDVGDSEQLQAFIEEAARKLGGVDILVTNTGGPPAGASLALDLDAWDAAYRSVLRSVLVAIRAAAPSLARSPAGSVVSVVSTSAKVPIPQLALSNTFRPAVVGLIKTLSAELAADGVRLNCLAPGRIATDRLRELDEHLAAQANTTVAEQRRRTEARIPLGRYGSPEELAEVALFLTSDRARYMTGQTIFVDGGITPTLL